MRLRIFLITFTIFTIILLSASYLFYIQIGQLQGINLESIQDRLYTQDTKIMLWAINNIDPTYLNNESLPESWGEVMTVDNDTLMITSSTNNKHKSLYMHKLPNLLDQATPILKAMEAKRPMISKTKDYMVAVKPLEEGSSIIGLKPRAWEAGLISDQTSAIKRHITQTKMILIVALTLGILVSFIAALIISVMVTRRTRQMLSALDDLSLGNFMARAPDSAIYEAKAFATSFERLKASLILALERFGVI